jgi:hypothetical protein
MMRFAVEQAKERADLMAEADAVHSLLSATGFGTPLSHIEVFFGRPKQETPEGVRVLQELLNVLQRMGRSVMDCAICLSPLDPTDQSQPIDVLDCMHAFHEACVRTHIRGRFEDRGGSVCPTCRAPIKLMSVSEGWDHPNLMKSPLL